MRSGEQVQVGAGGGVDLNLCEVLSFGRKGGRGNLLGIQPYVTVADYVSEAAFFNRLNGYFAVGKAAGFLNDRTVVVLPEFLGTWLVAAGESPAVSGAGSMTRAMMALGLRHLPSFLRRLITSPESGRAVAALFRIKAPSMAAIYQQVFSQLARTYGVHIVAGSIVLPDPDVADGAVRVGDGPLYNVSALFGPDGKACQPLVRKVFPTAEELPFVQPGKVEDLPIFFTPPGRLGVLICADAWFPSCYERMKTLGAEIIAVPSFSIKGDFADPWTGYSGYPPPPDVDPADVDHLTRREAWRKYALEGRLPLAGAHTGINVFLRGNLWNQPCTGRPVAISGDETWTGTGCTGASMVNLWVG